MDPKKKKRTIKTVCIPATAEHEGMYTAHVRLTWICPQCGQPRGPLTEAISYDGSRRLTVHGWSNPCGHVDKYDQVREEAKNNGLN